LHGLLAHPQRDWRASLEQFFARRESEGRIATAESRQSLVDYLKWWAITIGLEEPGSEPAPAHAAASGEAEGGFAESIGPLVPLLDEPFPSHLPSYVPELPPKLEWKPRVVKIERLQGFWDDYRELLASGHYEQGWWESILYGFTSALLPSSEPSIKITFDDGTVLFVLGGGPESGVLGGQGSRNSEARSDS
jgi:hypothetical protein